MIRWLSSGEVSLLPILISHKLDWFLVNYIFLGLVTTKRQDQRMYEKHQQCFPVDPRFLHLRLDSIKCNFLKPSGRSNPTYPAYKKWSKSTKSNKHLAIFKVYRWILLFQSAFNKAIWRATIGQKGQFFQVFSRFLHNRRHKLHEIKRLGFLQRTHQSLSILGHTQQPFPD